MAGHIDAVVHLFFNYADRQAIFFGAEENPLLAKEFSDRRSFQLGIDSFRRLRGCMRRGRAFAWYFWRIDFRASI